MKLEHCVIGLTLGTKADGYTIYIQSQYTADFARILAIAMKDGQANWDFNENSLKANVLSELLDRLPKPAIFAQMPKNDHTYHLLDTRDWSVSLFDVDGQFKTKFKAEDFLKRYKIS